MDLFDLHCDTLTKLYDLGSDLSDSPAAISQSTISRFEKYAQIFAVFSEPGLSDDDCYKRFFDVASYFKEMPFALTGEDIERTGNILSVEDARLLSGDISRLDALFRAGVRVITPLWAGSTCIGGSFDTDDGLTRFGTEVIKRSAELGIIPDISHASRRASDEIIDIAHWYSTPVIASHSDSYEVCPHPRNVTDKLAKKVKDSGGVIGICLHAPHLSADEASVDDVIRHAEHLILVTDESTVCLGCDFDGTDSLPRGVADQSDLYHIADRMASLGWPDDTIHDIFYKNANRFFKNNLGQKRKVILNQ